MFWRGSSTLALHAPIREGVLLPHEVTCLQPRSESHVTPCSPGSPGTDSPLIVLADDPCRDLMIVLDVSIVITALPRSPLRCTSPSRPPWVQNAYTLTFGGPPLLGARAATSWPPPGVHDRHRAFSFASLPAGLAQSSAG